MADTGTFHMLRNITHVGSTQCAFSHPPTGLHSHTNGMWLPGVDGQDGAAGGGLLSGGPAGAAGRSRSAAFLHVHTAGMLALVADPPTPAAPAGQMGGQMAEGGCPETLQFDEHRMGLLRAEFRYISLASAMLVTVAHGLTAARTDPQVPRALISSLPLSLPPSCLNLVCGSVVRAAQTLRRLTPRLASGLSTPCSSQSESFASPPN